MNISDITLKFFALLRAFFYLWITIESVFLAYLYWNAYKKYKSTPIIKAVEQLLFAIGINFFFMTIIAIVSAVNRNDPLYDWLIVIIPFFAFPVMLSIRKFRQESTAAVTDGKEKLKKLEKHYKLKK